MERKNRRRKGQTQIVLAYSRVDIHVVYGIQRNLVKPFGLHHQNAQLVGRRGVHYLGCEYGYFRNRVYSRRRARGENRQKKIYNAGLCSCGRFVLPYFLLCPRRRKSDCPRSTVCAVLSYRGLRSYHCKRQHVPDGYRTFHRGNRRTIHRILLHCNDVRAGHHPVHRGPYHGQQQKRNVVPVQRDLHYYRNRIDDVRQTRRQQTYSQKE